MIIWIVILILAIITFVAAYMSSRTWHWSNVTLVVLIFLTSILSALLTAKVVQIRAKFGPEIARAEKDLADYQERLEALTRGTRDGQIINRLAADEVRLPEGVDEIGGTIKLDHELYLLTRLRGRVWRNVGPPGPIDPETGALPVTIQQPRPHGIEPNSIVYVFEQGPAAQPDPNQGAQFLGEFEVADAGEAGITLRPVLQLDEQQLARLTASRGPWVIYGTMPVDRHELFADIPAERLPTLLPAESVAEYARHGTDATPDDDEFHRAALDETGQRLGPEDAAKSENVRWVYDRPLRDYNYLFQELARDRVVLLADMEAVTRDHERLVASLASAEKLGVFREEQKTMLAHDLKGIQKGRQAIEDLLSAIQRQVENAQRFLADALQENADLAQQLAFQQLGPEA